MARLQFHTHPLPTRVSRTSSAWPGKSVASFWAFTSHTFNVLSLLPLTRSRLSADHAIWYTEATWPRREARYLGQRKMMVDIRSSNMSDGSSVPTAVVLKLGCMLECIQSPTARPLPQTNLMITAHYIFVKLLQMSFPGCLLSGLHTT